MMRPFIFRYSFVTVLLLIASIASLSIGAVFINPFEAVSSLLHKIILLLTNIEHQECF